MRDTCGRDINFVNYKFRKFQIFTLLLQTNVETVSCEARHIVGIRIQTTKCNMYIKRETNKGLDYF